MDSKHDKDKMKASGKINKVEGSLLRAFLFGVASLLLLSSTLAHTYFEQWVWRWYAWLRYYHFAWWETYAVLETAASLLGVFVYLLFVLPAVARAMLRSARPIRLLLAMIVPMYIVLSGLYAFSKFTVVGRDRLENILRDAGGTQPSFIIMLAFVVLLPLTIITLLMLIWQKRKEARLLFKRRPKGLDVR